MASGASEVELSWGETPESGIRESGAGGGEPALSSTRMHARPKLDLANKEHTWNHQNPLTTPPAHSGDSPRAAGRYRSRR